MTRVMLTTLVHVLGYLARYTTAHGLHKLQIHLVRDDHYVCQQLALIEFALVKMQCVKCDNLEQP